MGRGNDGERCIEWNELEPIPLTGEWLVKLGFEKKLKVAEQNIDWKHPSTSLWVQEHLECDDFVVFDIHGGVMVSPKYVHKLQNLFFALTEVELITDQIFTPTEPIQD